MGQTTLLCLLCGFLITQREKLTAPILHNLINSGVQVKGRFVTATQNAHTDFFSCTFLEYILIFVFVNKLLVLLVQSF